MSRVADDGDCDSRTASVGLAPSSSRDAQRLLLQAKGAGKKAAANWNNVRKAKVRTALRRPGPRPAGTASSFNAVNGKYWRSGSASAEDESAEETRTGRRGALARDRSDVDSDRSTDDTTDPSDMDENDSSILLNMGQDTSAEQRQPTPAAGLSPQAVVPGQPAEAVDAEIRDVANDEDIGAAARSSRYDVHPQTIGQLKHEDLREQARYILYNNTKGHDPSTPVRCTDCFREGHMSYNCPSKRCEHCGTWGVHEPRFCPTWRRCQRCRERGHDKDACSSSLQGSAAEVPCDFCGSDQHLESQCDLMWKLPHLTFNTGQLFISISCAHCTSSQHLLGDCPTTRAPSYSTSWSLKSFEPSIVSNISRAAASMPNGRASGGIPQLKIKGRAQREPSPEEDELHIRSRANPPPTGRSHIRFADGLGRGRNLGPPNDTNGGDYYAPREPRVDRGSRDFHRDYRDRDQPFGPSNSRPRSRSPEPRYSGNQYRPPPPPVRGRGPPPPSRNSSRGRGRGGGGSQRGGKETTRPASGRGKRKNNRNS